MAGGILQLAAAKERPDPRMYSSNPSRRLFSGVYKSNTPFALQKFDVLFEGARSLRLSSPSTYTFKLKRFADILTQCTISIDLPSIWSPLIPPQVIPSDDSDADPVYTPWAPFDFRWIDHVGAKMIEKIEIICGSYTLQEYSGDYLLASAQRDLSSEKLDLFYEMIGHVPEMISPETVHNRNGNYPHAFYSETAASEGYYDGCEPSIRGRTLYIPLCAWFETHSQAAFPIGLLRNCEFEIRVTMRPIQQLYQIRDIYSATHSYVTPNYNVPLNQLYRFLSPPPGINQGASEYPDPRGEWDTNIHLICTYGFLSSHEMRIMANQEESVYMIKRVHERWERDISGVRKINIESIGDVTGWLFYFQRSDVNLRNEWSNYSNWAYRGIVPVNSNPAPISGYYPVQVNDPDTGELYDATIGPGINADGSLTGLTIAPLYSRANMRDILISMGILLDGNYREDVQPEGYYGSLEKWTRTTGNAPPGLYCYQFGLNASNWAFQPSGSLNSNKFRKIELEITTIAPPADPNAQSTTICDPDTGEIIGTTKPLWRLNQYSYDMFLAEERINFVTFSGGSVGLAYAW